MKAILTSTAVVAAAVLGLAAYTAGAAPTRTSTTVIKLKATSLSSALVDTPPLKVFGAGDAVVFRLKLTSPATGKQLGTGTGNCQRYSGANNAKPEIDVCTDTFTLAGGQIIAIGTVVDEAQHARLAVIGGTGAYSGARGEVVETVTGEVSSLLTLTLAG
jgi:hypothetical protein